MSDNGMKQEEIENQQNQDIEIAELANKELLARDQRIKELEKQLAVSKLYSHVGDKDGEEETQYISSQDAAKKITSSGVSNLEFWKSMLAICDNEGGANNDKTFGVKYGTAVYDFIKGCIDDCEDDENKFNLLYQTRIGEDDKTDYLAYLKSKQ